MKVTGTHINYFFVCKRKLWLFANGIQMEQESDTVYEGKLIHEYSYRHLDTRYREIMIDNIRIDRYDTVRKEIHEIKKSDKIESAHIMQVKYYMCVLKQYGVEVKRAVLEYPKLRKTVEVNYENMMCNEVEAVINEIEKISTQKEPPPVLNGKICKKCAYYDFCFVGQD